MPAALSPADEADEPVDPDVGVALTDRSELVAVAVVAGAESAARSESKKTRIELMSK